MIQIKREATLIAQSVDTQRYGIDPISIITVISTLLPMLMNLPCFKSEDVPAKEFLSERYDSATGRFDEHVYDQCRPKTRRAARQEGMHHLGRDGLDEITHKSLMHAMMADDETVATCALEAANTQN